MCSRQECIGGGESTECRGRVGGSSKVHAGPLKGTCSYPKHLLQPAQLERTDPQKCTGVRHAVSKLGGECLVLCWFSHIHVSRLGGWEREMVPTASFVLGKVFQRCLSLQHRL